MSLRVPILEDSLPAAEVLAHALRDVAGAVDWRYAAREPEYLAALAMPLDLVLAADDLPGLGVGRALQLLGAHAPDIPLIVIATPEAEARRDRVA